MGHSILKNREFEGMEDSFSSFSEKKHRKTDKRRISLARPSYVVVQHDEEETQNNTT
jgi:hypothetical protein